MLRIITSRTAGQQFAASLTAVRNTRFQHGSASSSPSHKKMLGVAAGLFAGAALLNDQAFCDSKDDKIRKLEQRVQELQEKMKVQFDVAETTGQGDAIFSWDKGLTDCFPSDAKPFERDMHGGFNEDEETGIVYTGIPGYGLCAISPDLKTWKRIGTDERLKANIHGIVIFKHKGVTNIAVAQNTEARILIIGLDGKVKQQLDQPVGGEFNFAEANAYYSEAPSQQRPQAAPPTPSFACTDVTFLDGKLYVVTGYCPGDFVLTASEENGVWKWGPIAWGGKGKAPGKFQTAHGIFAYDGNIFVANREAHQVVEFTKDGHLVRCLPDIPYTARICNVARADNYFVMNELAPITSHPSKTASIYAHSGERLLSNIQPGTLGIPVLKHIHHTWPHYVTDKKTGERTLYLLVHGWSDGKYAVLKHEPHGKPSVPLMERK
eukprot:m.340729 g.340729  ORF g.340729 m.340729 type:complete len:435 (-) comp19489_c0_seq1:69-1373(-)